jgi:nitrogen fixation/metabolism regulation signal transduction histidine kinase
VRLRHEDRVAALALLGGLPAVVSAAVLGWAAPLEDVGRAALAAVLVAVWLLAGLAARRAVVRPLQTLVNVLGALHAGDYGFRARVGGGGALRDVHLELNRLGGTLRRERLWATEAAAMLRKVMDAIDVAVFAFDEGGKLRLVNRGGEALLGQEAERLLAKPAAELGLRFALEGETPRIVDLSLPGGGGRWEVRRGDARQGGLPLDLVVLSDVSRALRGEERLAWQRLIRVLGHELNNSLAPIRSLAGSLEALIERKPRPPDWEDDARRGLAVIASRADALTRFMDGYATLARLPAPRPERVDLADVVQRVVRLETRVPVRVSAGPPTVVTADRDQLEQLLINLVRNAADASLATGTAVEVGWRLASGPAPTLLVWVDDEGPGIANPANLFVPFFTTKAQGSGIGLTLSRQIAEAHGGTLTLANREPPPGARALLRLPRGDA